jgi:predicted lipoprotein
MNLTAEEIIQLTTTTMRKLLPDDKLDRIMRISDDLKGILARQRELENEVYELRKEVDKRAKVASVLAERLLILESQAKV